jgi:hypothetical protein
VAIESDASRGSTLASGDIRITAAVSLGESRPRLPTFKHWGSGEFAASELLITTKLNGRRRRAPWDIYKRQAIPTLGI